MRVRPVPLADLDPTNPADAICFGSASIANPGLLPVAGAPAGSLCADTDWQITARATDARSGVSVTLSQGVTVRREIVGSAPDLQLRPPCRTTNDFATPISSGSSRPPAPSRSLP